MKKSQTVFVVANAATGEWVSVAESLAVAEAYITMRNIRSWTNVTSVEVLTRADIDVTKVRDVQLADQSENRARLVARGRCPDCGKQGERKGHQDCQFPS